MSPTQGFSARSTMAAAAILISVGAWAKLPAPVLSDEAKAQAALTAAKTAHGGKVEAYRLCRVMEQVATGYQARAKQAGQAAPTPVATPACADPGPFMPAGSAPQAVSTATQAAKPPAAKK